MSTIEIKERILNYMETADDRVLEANASRDYSLTEEQMNIVQERREEYLAGKSKTYDWEDVKKMIGKN